MFPFISSPPPFSESILLLGCLPICNVTHLIVSCAWLTFHSRRAASQTLQAMDEEGLTTSLVGGDFRYKLEVGLYTSIPDIISR